MAEERGEQGIDVGIVENLVGQVVDLGGLERLEKAIARRRRELKARRAEGGDPEGPRSLSRLKESRPYKDGYLQAETRIYRHENGRESERGPYWYFRYHEGGKQKKLYLGRTKDPEETLETKRGQRCELERQGNGSDTPPAGDRGFRRRLRGRDVEGGTVPGSGPESAEGAPYDLPSEELRLLE